MTAASSGLQAVRTRSAWLARIVQPPPNLHEGPLFGRALADAIALVGLRDEPADTDAASRNARAAPLPKTVPRAVPPAPSVRAGNQSIAAPAFARAAPAHTLSAAAERARRAANAATARAPIALARFAPQPLVDQLSRRARIVAATTIARRGDHSAVAPGSPRMPTASARPSSAVAARPRRSAPWSADAFAGPPSPAFDGSRAHDRSLAAAMPSAVADAAAIATTSLRARMLESARGRHRRAVSALDEPAIEQDWSRSMLGPVAPATLLEQLAATPRAPSVPAAQTARRVAARARAPRRDRARSSSATAPADPRERERDGAFDRPSAVRSSSIAASQFADDVPRAAPAPAFEPAPHVPALPPFAWPRSLAEPALAMAAVAAAQRAPSPAGEDQRDLDLLSAKIERILAEQARRHGIDV